MDTIEFQQPRHEKCVQPPQKPAESWREIGAQVARGISYMSAITPSPEARANIASLQKIILPFCKMVVAVARLHPAIWLIEATVVAPPATHNPSP